MELDEYVACMYEGEAERAVLDILLDNDKLIFSREELLEEEPIARCKPKDFERRYLRKSFLGKISLLRVIDSRTEQFNLSKAYESKVNIKTIITAPEIEMLIILAENRLKDFIKYENKRKHENKPSTFCKEILKYHDVKSYDFIIEYFSDVELLLKAIKEYKRVSKIKKNEYSLYDIIKW